MRSVQVSKPKGPLEIVERDIPEPGARHVRKSKLGHEIAGIIDVVGITYLKSFPKWDR